MNLFKNILVSRYRILLFAILIFLIPCCKKDDAPKDLNKVTLQTEGSEEDVLQLNAFGLIHSPEGKINFIKTGNQYKVWIGIGNKGYCFTSSDMQTLTPGNGSTNGVANPVLTPGLAGVDPGYAGFGTVLPSENNHQLLSFYHTETYDWQGIGHDPGKYWAQIAFATSDNGGLNWNKQGVVITGRDPKPATPQRSANGAGMPITIAHDGYLYTFYSDWRTLQGQATGADEIHVARAAINTNGKPGSWFKYFNGNFSEPGLGGMSTAVIKRPVAYPNSSYTSLGNITFNKAINAFIAIITSNDAFYYALSKDLINWTDAVPFFTYPVMNSQLKNGDPWYLYPSFISPNQDNDRTTDANGYLYFGKAAFNQTPHNLKRIRLKISF